MYRQVCFDDIPLASTHLTTVHQGAAPILAAATHGGRGDGGRELSYLLISRLRWAVAGRRNIMNNTDILIMPQLAFTSLARVSVASPTQGGDSFETRRRRLLRPQGAAPARKVSWEDVSSKLHTGSSASLTHSVLSFRRTWVVHAGSVGFGMGFGGQGREISKTLDSELMEFWRYGRENRTYQTTRSASCCKQDKLRLPVRSQGLLWTRGEAEPPSERLMTRGQTITRSRIFYHDEQYCAIF